jgi:cytochrome P450
MVATVDHDHHRYRRNILSGFFSKRSVKELSPVVEEKVLKLMQRFATAHREESIMRLDDAFSALASDVITQYSFGKSWDFLDDENFRRDIRSAITETSNVIHINRFFPLFAWTLRMVPKWLVCKIQPGKVTLFKFTKPIFEFTASSANGKRESKKGTIFEQLTDPILPPEERTLARVGQETSVILQAGTESISRSLTIAAFHLAYQPSMREKLREELLSVLPTAGGTATWAQLEQLPYLVCITSPEYNMTAVPDILRLALCTNASVSRTDW